MVETEYYAIAYDEMKRLGIQDYLYYLRLCLIKKIKEGNKYTPDKKIARLFNYKSITQYFYDVKKSQQIKFNIIDYNKYFTNTDGVYQLIQEVFSDS